MAATLAMLCVDVEAKVAFIEKRLLKIAFCEIIVLQVLQLGVENAVVREYKIQNGWPESMSSD